MTRLLRGVVCAAIVLAPAAARADSDSADVAARVAEQWRAAGAKAVSLPTKFLFDDDRQLIAIPAAEDAAACTHIALVAARGLSFRARLSDAPSDPLLPPEPGARGASSAGVVGLSRCDAQRPVRYIEVRSEAGRGAIEIVVAHGPAALPPLGTIIPERTGGALPPAGDAGALSALAPQDKRLETAEQRGRREGATVAARVTVRAGDEGSGDAALDLTAGCHRFDVVGLERVDRAGRRYRLDIDAELRDGDRVIARDRTEAPDARVEACVAAPARLALVYAGAVPGSDVVVAHGRWPLPARLPSIWGATARSRIARMMFVRHVAVPAEDPIFLAQGSSGTTPIAIPVEVGGCYVATVAVTHGRARQLQLRATVGARESVDERGAAEEAALSAFCVRAHESARIEVLARPSGVAWGLAVYRVKSGLWAEAP